jgi:hypothetical protein
MRLPAPLDEGAKIRFGNRAEMIAATIESSCAPAYSRLWKNHERAFEHEPLVVGLLTAAF